MQSKKANENLIYIFIWLIVISLPVFTLRNLDDFSWTKVLIELLRLLPFSLIFIINNSILVPMLLFKKKNLQYLLYLSVIILVITYFFDSSKFIHDALSPADFDPHDIPPPPFDGPGPMNPMHPPMHGHPHQKVGFSGKMFDWVIISYLVVGFNSAIKFVFKRQEEEQQIEVQKKIHLQTELSFLRNQISPHFFMNTLNNIHALIEIDQVQAKESVIQLSKLMRYLLDGSKEGIATIKAEIEFLQSYIDLMRLRYSDRVKIEVTFDVKKQNLKK